MLKSYVGIAILLAFSPFALANELFTALEGESGNGIYSPYSIEQAYAILYAAADPQPAQKLQQIFQFPEKIQDLANRFRSVEKRLVGEKDDFTLRVANALWINQSFPINQGGIKDLTTMFTADIFPLEVAKGASPINSWVAQKTSGKITNLFDEGSVNQDTISLLVNAIYLKAHWEFQFRKQLTRPQDFHVSSSETVQHPFMNGTFRLPYVKTGNYTAVELPYKNNDVRFVGILPDAQESLDQFQSHLEIPEVLSALKKSFSQRVLVTMPKLKFSKTYGLDGVLAKLGFEGGVFSKILKNRKLITKPAIHQAFVQIDEEGTEAAAATGVKFGVAAVQAKPPEFRADHPYLFLVVDRVTDTVLFWGKVVKPEFN